jgi:hypothetical protein
MPFYVYIIQSETDDSYYKGFSEDVFKRIAQANQFIPKQKSLEIGLLRRDSRGGNIKYWGRFLESSIMV